MVQASCSFCSQTAAANCQQMDKWVSHASAPLPFEQSMDCLASGRSLGLAGHHATRQQSPTPSSLCAVQLLLGRTATGAGGSSEVLAAKLANTLCSRAIKTLPAILQQVRALPPPGAGEGSQSTESQHHAAGSVVDTDSARWPAETLYLLSTPCSKTATCCRRLAPRQQVGCAACCNLSPHGAGGAAGRAALCLFCPSSR